MDKEIRQTIGNQDFHVCLKLFSDEDHPRSMAWGEMLVSLNNEPVWCSESENGEELPVVWAWIELLEFLGDKWSWLIMEERYPVPINPFHPGTMRYEAEKRWEGMGEESYLEEDERLFRFESRHDLAMGMKGIFLPSLFVLRQGERVWICSDKVRVLAGFQETVDVLTSLGDCLAAFIEDTQSPRSGRAVQRWRTRKQRARDHFWELRTGMSRDLRSSLEQGKSPQVFWEADPENLTFDNELLAAARLSAGVGSWGRRNTPVYWRKVHGAGGAGRVNYAGFLHIKGKCREDEGIEV